MSQCRLPRTVTGLGTVKGPVVSASHATGSVLRPYTKHQSGLAPVNMIHKNRPRAGGLGRNPLQLADPP